MNSAVYSWSSTDLNSYHTRCSAISGIQRYLLWPSMAAMLVAATVILVNSRKVDRLQGPNTTLIVLWRRPCIS
ncbi:hypothetical protein GY45DRAFT_941254 [Cubamyces sp. BRFM 1775]|nr:hypothetical protein GY45DRAFT_941254 [Cubamyces sp. BRFM 1775]